MDLFHSQDPYQAIIPMKHITQSKSPNFYNKNTKQPTKHETKPQKDQNKEGKHKLKKREQKLFKEKCFPILAP